MNVRIAAPVLGFITAMTLAACGSSGGSTSYPLLPGAPGSSSVTPTASPTVQPTAPTGTITAPPVSPSPGATATPTPVPGSSLVSSPSGQAVEAQNGLSYLSGAATLAGPGGISQLITQAPTLSSVVRRTLGHGIRPLAGGGGNCIVSGSQSYTLSLSLNNANGQTTYVYTGFYDGACAQREYQFDATAAAYADGANIVGSGQQTYYAPSTGDLLATNTLTYISLTGLGTSNVNELVRGSSSAGQGGNITTTAGFGTECSAAGTAVTCGDGLVINSARAGGSSGLVLSTAYGSGGLATAAVSSLESAALNDLTLTSQTGSPFWTVSGGTPGTPATATVTNSGSTVTIAINDATNSAAETLTLTNNAYGVLTAVSGTITNTATNTVVSHFSTDGYGSGTITYSDSTTGTVSDFLLL